MRPSYHILFSRPAAHQPGVNDPPRLSHVPECCLQSRLIAVYRHALLPFRMVTRHPDSRAVQGYVMQTRTRRTTASQR